ncbi:hypothetical protein [Paraburkholderia fungorum]|uniref:hypothetical protein n=1 Tax=Paraburkholderia fungorum TaxID=134537 RepID=UPI00115F8BAC|nr:hypothetical protein [Paraburkholderia fungorum]
MTETIEIEHGRDVQFRRRAKQLAAVRLDVQSNHVVVLARDAAVVGGFVLQWPRIADIVREIEARAADATWSADRTARRLACRNDESIPARIALASSSMPFRSQHAANK